MNRSRFSTLLKRYPASVGILLVLLVAFVVVATLPGGPSRTFLYFGAMPARLADAWFSFQAGDRTLEPWRVAGTLFSAVFLHADAAHLLHNALFLWIFAAILEPMVGGGRLVVLFLLAGALGNVAQAFVTPTSLVPVIGASGGVAGLEGCYLSLALRFSLPWPHVFPISRPVPPHQLVLLCLVNFYLDVFATFSGGWGKPIAYAAHVGGFLAGGLLAGFLRPRTTESFH